jgi:hypothetical protein
VLTDIDQLAPLGAPAGDRTAATALSVAIVGSVRAVLLPDDLTAPGIDGDGHEPAIGLLDGDAVEVALGLMLADVTVALELTLTDVIKFEGSTVEQYN